MLCQNLKKEFKVTELELQRMLALVKKEKRIDFCNSEVSISHDRNDPEYKAEIKSWIGIFNEASVKIFNTEPDIKKFEQFRVLVGIKPKPIYTLSALDCPMRRDGQCRMEECPVNCRKINKSDYFD